MDTTEETTISNEITFDNLFDARDQFQTNFAKKELGGIMKNIVIQATPQNNQVYADDEIVKLLNGAMNDVADAAFGNTDNDNSFMGGLKELVNRYASIEADYRFQQAEAKQQFKNVTLDNEKGREELYGLFKRKYSITDPTLLKRYRAELSSYLSTEAEDIVISIGKEVGEAIVKAQQKQAVVTETLKAITDEKEDILKELTDDEEEEEEEKPATDTSGDVDMDGSETDFDNDENSDDEEDSSALDNFEEGDDGNSSLVGDAGAESFDDPTVGSDTTTADDAGEPLMDDGFIFADDTVSVSQDIPVENDNVVLTETSPNDPELATISEVKGIEEELEENVNDKLNEVNISVTEVSDEEVPDNEEEVAEKLETENPSEEEEIKPDITPSDVDDPGNFSNNVEFPKDSDVSSENITFVNSEEAFLYFGNIEFKKFHLELQKEYYQQSLEGIGDFLKKIPKSFSAVAKDKREKIKGFIQKHFGSRAECLVKMHGFLSAIKNNKEKIKNAFKKQNKQGQEGWPEFKAIMSALGFGAGFAVVLEGILTILTGAGLASIPVIGGAAAAMAIVIGIIEIIIGALLMMPYIIFMRHTMNNDVAARDLLHEMSCTIREYKKAKSKDIKSSLIRMFKKQWKTLQDLIKKQPFLWKDKIKDLPKYDQCEEFYDDYCGGNSSSENYDYKMTREEYNKMIYGNENIGAVLYPLSPSRIDEKKLPSMKALAAVFVKGEETLPNFIDARFSQLKEIAGVEQDEEFTKKVNDYETLSKEALNLAIQQRNALNNVGLAPWGLVDPMHPDPIAFAVGKKLYKKCKGTLGNSYSAESISPMRKIESVEDAIDVIFGLECIKKSYEVSGLPVYYTVYKSLEETLWTNVLNFPDDEKQAIHNVAEISKLDIDEKALIETDFLTSIELAVDNMTTKPGETGDANSDIVSKAKERVSAYLTREPDSEEMGIIEAICSGKDAVDYMPTLFEKFIIKLGKDNIQDDDFELTPTDTAKENLDAIQIINRAKCLTTLHEFINGANVLSGKSLEEFNDHILGTII